MASERREFARNLRRRPTPAEDVLWERLRGSRFRGSKFRRQVPFDRFVVDLLSRRQTRHRPPDCDPGDGKQHEWFSDYDAGRTEVLERVGVRVIRFTNAEVCDDLDLVLGELTRNWACPSAEWLGPLTPGPSPVGRGKRTVAHPRSRRPVLDQDRWEAANKKTPFSSLFPKSMLSFFSNGTRRKRRSRRSRRRGGEERQGEERPTSDNQKRIRGLDIGDEKASQAFGVVQNGDGNGACRPRSVRGEGEPAWELKSCRILAPNLTE